MDVDVCVCTGREGDQQTERNTDRKRETGLITRNVGQIVALSLLKVKYLHGSWDATMRKD